MVEKKVDTIIKLPDGMANDLKKLEGDLEKADHAIEVLKKLGMETGPLEEKLSWSKNVRKTLLDEFG